MKIKWVFIFGLVILISSCKTGYYHRFTAAGLMKEKALQQHESPAAEEAVRFSAPGVDKPDGEAKEFLPDDGNTSQKPAAKPLPDSRDELFTETVMPPVPAFVPEDTTRKNPENRSKQLDEAPLEPLSKTALILSVLGIIPVFGIFFSIAALILAMVSLDKINNSGKLYRGRKQAWWALGISLFFLLILFIFGGVLVLQNGIII